MFSNNVKPSEIIKNRGSKATKVLFAVKALNDITGGAERVLCDVASALSRRGYDVVVLSFDPPDGHSYYPLDSNVRRIQLGIGDTFNRAKPKETLRRILALRRTIVNESPHVVVGFMHSMFVLTAFSMIGKNIKVLGSEHIVPEHYRKRKLEFFLFLLSSLFLSKITVLSEKIRNIYPLVLRRKMFVIPNPVHLPAYQETLQNKENIILNVGRLEEQKDQRTLIEAFGKIAHKYPEWRVRIFGDGRLRNDLQEMINRLGLGDRVILAGTTKEIAKEYSKARIFAIPSLYESFGLATAEAMAHRLPAIGFDDCPGTNELIVSGVNGILCRGDDRVQRYAEGLEMLMLDEMLRDRLGSEASRTAAKFSLDSVVDEWEKFLNLA